MKTGCDHRSDGTIEAVVFCVLGLDMGFHEITVLLPCHSLEDFPTYLEGLEAEGLLAAWTALWHPSLIHAAGKLPGWWRADELPEDLTGKLLVVPGLSEGWLACDFDEVAESQAAVVVRGKTKREEIVAAALAAVEEAPSFDPETVADFFALGYCRLQVELLTRLGRYTSTIDEERLQSSVLEAVQAATSGDRAATRTSLQKAFDHLCESRRYFYPVDPHLIDLTLIADSTLGESLQDELASPVAKNCLLDGKTLEKVANTEPVTLQALRTGLEEGTLEIIGGEYKPLEFALLPEEAWREGLLRGIATYEQILGVRPTIYGRRRAGLSPLLPQLLCRTGFQSALHFTLDDGQFPTTYHPKMRWDSADGSLVEAVTQLPIDASRCEPFLELGRRLSEEIDRGDATALIFAHWPGTSSVWYQDLQRVARYTPALGSFAKLSDYIDDTVTAAEYARFKPDDYRTPFLKQSVSAAQTDYLASIGNSYRGLQNGVIAPVLEEPLATFLQAGTEAREAKGRLLVNSQSFPVEMAVPPIEGSSAWQWAEVPGMGFTWIPNERAAKKGDPLVQIENRTLRNAYCEVVISETGGGIQSVRDFRTRGNRVSQQVALRLPGKLASPYSRRDPDLDAIYSVMVADSIETGIDDPAFAEIVSRGRLVDKEGENLAHFEQRTRLGASSRTVEIEIALRPIVMPVAAPWDSYYAVRFAFPDKELAWSRNLGLSGFPTELYRLEAPLFVACEAKSWRTSILSGGLPFHRRVLDRTLDTIFVVAGQTPAVEGEALTARLGIGIDVPHPASAALQFVNPRVTIYPASEPPGAESGWLFHISAKNVVATGWEAIENGFRVRLRETAGLAGQICLRCWRGVGVARQTDFLGNTLCELTVEHDKIWVEVHSHEWTQIEVLFAT